MNGCCLCRNESIKDLGVILDRKLTFIPHIDIVIKKASKALLFVIRNTKFLPQPSTIPELKYYYTTVLFEVFLNTAR